MFNMEVRVKTIQMPIDEITIKDLYVVEMNVFTTTPFGGFNFGNIHQWKTFGVYETENVANFVAESIRNEQIIV